MSPSPDGGVALRAWRRVRRDLGRKLTAVLLALSVWVVLENLVVGEVERELDVIVVATRAEAREARLRTDAIYVVVPRDVLLLGRDPARVRATLRGLRSDVQDLRLSALFELDPEALSGVDEAPVILQLDREDFLVQSGERRPALTDFRLSHSLVELSLARRATLDVNLGPDNVATSGRPASGYSFYSSRIVVRPNSQMLIGPRPVIEQLRAQPALLKLAPVSVDGRAAPLTQNVGLSDTLLAQGVSLDTRDGRVEVTVPIVPDDMDVLLVSIPVRYLNEDSLATRGLRSTARTTTLDVIVRGPQPELAGLPPEQLARQIFLIFDWREAELLRDRPAVTVARASLSRDVRVLDASSNLPPTIEYALEALPGGP